jgi:hypothetical protein
LIPGGTVMPTIAMRQSFTMLQGINDITFETYATI